MPQSLSNIVLHTVFSTRYRLPLLSTGIQPRMHAYLATLVRNQNCECYRVGGVEDHVHLAIRLSRTIAVCDLLESIKTTSSKWIKKQPGNYEKFSWQKGYGIFSVDPGGVTSVCRYIDNQAHHHRKITFQDEYRALMLQNGIEIDERYVWD